MKSMIEYQIKPASLCVFLIMYLSCCDTKSNQKQISDSVDIEEKRLDSLTIQKSEKDWLLVPGVSAGRTRINQNAEEVFKTFGKPDGGDAAMGKSVAIWFANHDSTSFATSIYTVRDMGENPIARVKQIRVTSHRFKTKEGIGPSSFLSKIKSVYDLKKVEDYEDSGLKYTVYNNDKGIAFEISSDEKCVAVIIFSKEKDMPGTYLPLRVTNRHIFKK